jgi:hypothetical protein
VLLKRRSSIIGLAGMRRPGDKRPARREARLARAVATGAAVVAAAGLAVAPQARADGSIGASLEYAYENGSSLLVTTGATTGYGMAPDTSPSIAATSPTTYEAAFQANTTHLWVTGSLGSGDLGQSMQPGTSPSLALLSDGAYAIAYDDANNHIAVYTTSTASGLDRGEGPAAIQLDPSTHPSIAAYTGTVNFQLAFQDSNHVLWMTLPDGDLFNTMQAMDPVTSPSMTVLPNGNWEIAFQGNDNTLWTMGSNQPAQSTGLPMDPASSPAITVAANNTYEIAYENKSESLSITGTFSPATDLKEAMAPGATPSAVGIDEVDLDTGEHLTGVEIAYQGKSNMLCMYHFSATFDPAIANDHVGPFSGPSAPSLTNSGMFVGHHH